MRKLRNAFLLSAALAATGFATAAAADMPTKAAPLYQEAAKATWSDFYFGLSAGYGWGGIDPTDFASSFGSMKPKGLIWGGQFGYQHQFQNVVFGIEADALSLNGKGDLSNISCGGSCGVAGKFDLVGTVRARLGFANGGWLFYGTGGLAWGHTAVDVSGTGTFANTSIGWAGGAGVEVALSKNWSVRAQYLHYDFGNDTVASLVPVKNTLDAATVGVNFRF